VIRENVDDVFERIRNRVDLKEVQSKYGSVQKLIDEKPVTILFKGKVFISEDKEWHQILRNIDEELKNEEIDFIEDYRLKDAINRDYLVICYKNISRFEILQIFKSNMKLSYKSTRHTPPFRILNINIPLDLLNDLIKAKEHLAKLDLEYLGRDVLYDGRIYKERIYVGRIRGD